MFHLHFLDSGQYAFCNSREALFGSSDSLKIKTEIFACVKIISCGVKYIRGLFTGKLRKIIPYTGILMNRLLCIDILEAHKSFFFFLKNFNVRGFNFIWLI